ncbi:TPA: diguanylate cyclase [Legionella pneumophila]|nr:diguanylate cyclase [Legionella pneumophila]HAU0352111.1 diguanylate cyclase [Legionella pneumophila]HAU0355287.1 diguanylate cyclase [Legionella pneumophila]HAU0361456.1 diguanylate cyclase [Legionella pneumophila]HAU0370231.1 diguanylate cyclase [Legionella pneumophila]
MAKNILRALTKPIEYENNIINIGASIGLRIVTPINDSVEKILAEADLAMYRAKQSIKEKIIVFEPLSSHS